MPEEQKTEENNIILVGTKPLMNYVKGVSIKFTKDSSKEVKIKARGKYMNKAIDIAEIIKKKPLNNEEIKIKEIKTDSIALKNNEGKNINVSTIEIILIQE